MSLTRIAVREWVTEGGGYLKWDPCIFCPSGQNDHTRLFHSRAAAKAAVGAGFATRFHPLI